MAINLRTTAPLSLILVRYGSRAVTLLSLLAVELMDIYSRSSVTIVIHGHPTLFTALTTRTLRFRCFLVGLLVLPGARDMSLNVDQA
jgi:hypothetical protein